MNPSLEPSNPKVVISIINYRTADLTIQCAKSVLDDIRDLDCQVVIVDNASGDGSADEIQTWIDSDIGHQGVILVRSPRNTGFSGGHNQGIGAAAAEYYLLLNSDAVLLPGFLKSILSAADNAPNIGLFAPRIDYDTGAQQVNCFRFHSPASEFIRGAASGPVTRALRRYEVPLDMPPSQDQIDWASFACILLRTRMIKDVGAMDTGYFLYFEDVEYCWRARQKDWHVAYVPKARAIHFRGGSGPVKALEKEKKRLPSYFYASRTRMLRQFYGWFGLLLANLFWLTGRGIAHLRALFGRAAPKTNHCEAQDIWTNVFTPLGDSRAPKE